MMKFLVGKNEFADMLSANIYARANGGQVVMVWA
jgi:hypothetical protein